MCVCVFLCPGVWNEFVQRVLARMRQIKGFGGDMGKPHWAKFNDVRASVGALMVAHTPR